MDTQVGPGWKQTPCVTEPISSEQPLLSAILAATSRAQNVKPEDLPPLQNIVDVEALGGLFARPDASGRVLFQYCDHLVEVRADGVVRLFEAAESSSSE